MSSTGCRSSPLPPTQSVRATSTASWTPTSRLPHRRPIIVRDSGPDRRRQPVGPGMERQDVGPVDDRRVEHHPRDQRRQRRAVEQLQHDRAAHRPPAEEDLPRALPDGIPHRRLDVAPLGQPEVVAPVRARPARPRRCGSSARARSNRGRAAAGSRGPSPPAGPRARGRGRPSGRSAGRRAPPPRPASVPSSPPMPMWPGGQPERDLRRRAVEVRVPPRRPGREVAAVQAEQDPLDGPRPRGRRRRRPHPGVAGSPVEPEPVAARHDRLERPGPARGCPGAPQGCRVVGPLTVGREDAPGEV